MMAFVLEYLHSDCGAARKSRSRRGRGVPAESMSARGEVRTDIVY